MKSNRLTIILVAIVLLGLGGALALLSAQWSREARRVQETKAACAKMVWAVNFRELETHSILGEISAKLPDEPKLRDAFEEFRASVKDALQEWNDNDRRFQEGLNAKPVNLDTVREEVRRKEFDATRDALIELLTPQAKKTEGSVPHE